MLRREQHVLHDLSDNKESSEITKLLSKSMETSDRDLNNHNVSTHTVDNPNVNCWQYNGIH